MPRGKRQEPAAAVAGEVPPAPQESVEASLDVGAKLYTYEAVPGFEARWDGPQASGTGKPGRPPWEPISPVDVRVLVNAHHDLVGGYKVLDALEELKCGPKVIRRCRRRRKRTAAEIHERGEGPLEG